MSRSRGPASGGRPTLLGVATPRKMYSAELDSFFLGNAAAPRRVRDVIVCTGDPTVAPTADELRNHLPIGLPSAVHHGVSVAPLDLGRGVAIERLDADETELVMNACSPRGHYFWPIRQFGQRYSFVKDVDLASVEQTRHSWDDDNCLTDALTLSRLVRDNAYSTQYAARIIDHDDGERTVAFTLGSEGKHVYRLRRDREWLDRSEGAELRDLLSAYWQAEPTLPSRVRRAMWRTEYASWLRWGDLEVATIISGLEALLKTDRHKATRQFTHRVPALAEEVGVDGVTSKSCVGMYDARSEWVHGAHVRLFTAGGEAQGARDDEVGPQTDEQRSAVAEISRLQDTLRAAVRKCFEDADFRSVFEEDERIRSRWPA